MNKTRAHIKHMAPGIRIQFVLLCLAILFAVLPAKDARAEDPGEQRGDAIGESHQPHGQSLSELEELAKKSFDEKRYRISLTIYRQYRSILEDSPWAPIQPDLLHNQVVTAIHADQYGLAVAYLRQLDIVAHSPEIDEKINAICRLIEHRVYQMAPETQFVRGESPTFQKWSQIHRHSRLDTINAVLIVWYTLFLLVAVFFLIKKYRRQTYRRYIAVLSFLWGTAAIFMLMSVIERRTIMDLRFGVLINSGSLSLEPSSPPNPLNDLSFVEGLTVQILSDNDTWVQIERADGVIAWAAAEDVREIKVPKENF